MLNTNILVFILDPLFRPYLAQIMENFEIIKGRVQTWHFGTYRRRVYLGWNYNTFRSHRDRAGTEGVIEITLETG